MQDRAEVQTNFRPIDGQTGDGQRVAIGAASTRSAAMDYGKEHHIFVTKLSWINFGNNVVTASQPAGGPPEVGGSFPLAAGAVYRYIPTGSDDNYVAVIEDAAANDITGHLYIGRAEP